jgi:hypothetical protein
MKYRGLLSLGGRELVSQRQHPNLPIEEFFRALVYAEGAGHFLHMSNLNLTVFRQAWVRELVEFDEIVVGL